MNPSEKRKAYLQRAAERLAKQKKEEAAKDEAFYQRVTTGTQWKLFGLGVFVCLLINVLVTIDIFVDGETKPLPVGSYQHDRSTYIARDAIVWVGEDIFTPYYKDFVSVDYESFTLTNSYLFNKAKYISFIGHTMGDPERFKAYERISIFEWFPSLQIMLLIPLFVFLFKRKHVFFTFMRFACITVIIPGSLIILYFLMV